MSKLTLVRMALQNNPNMTIVGAAEVSYPPPIAGGWSHTVDFYVAPKQQGAEYRAERLQAMMMSLVPGLEPTCKDNFYDWPQRIEFGKLYFDELYFDNDIISIVRLVDGKERKEYCRELRRRIWVRLFPSEQIAADALKGRNVYNMSKGFIARYKGTLVPMRRSRIR